jgi:probable phosphoglycerate mutase
MEKTMQLILVRHAETTMISENRIHGHLDAPLSAEGLKDTQKTADFFRSQTFDALYCSSLGRALHTAEIIGEAINLTPIPVDNLRERYYGRLEGKPLDLFEPDGSGPWFLRPYVNLTLRFTGESEAHFVKRVLKSTQEIISNHQGQRIMLVIHWGILGILSQYFQGKDVNNWRVIGPWIACGISEFHSNNSHWQVIKMDDGSHLL